MLRVIFLQTIAIPVLFRWCKVLHNPSAEFSMVSYQRWDWHISIDRPLPHFYHPIFHIILYNFIFQQFIEPNLIITIFILRYPFSDTPSILYNFSKNKVSNTPGPICCHIFSLNHQIIFTLFNMLINIWTTGIINICITCLINLNISYLGGFLVSTSDKFCRLVWKCGNITSNDEVFQIKYWP